MCAVIALCRWPSVGTPSTSRATWCRVQSPHPCTWRWGSACPCARMRVCMKTPPGLRCDANAGRTAVANTAKLKSLRVALPLAMQGALPGAVPIALPDTNGRTHFDHGPAGYMFSLCSCLMSSSVPPCAQVDGCTSQCAVLAFSRHLHPAPLYEDVPCVCSRAFACSLGERLKPARGRGAPCCERAACGSPRGTPRETCPHPAHLSLLLLSVRSPT
jgi:hypothetical protein